jgi:hypothetical protein
MATTIEDVREVAQALWGYRVRLTEHNEDDGEHVCSLWLAGGGGLAFLGEGPTWLAALVDACTQSGIRP